MTLRIPVGEHWTCPHGHVTGFFRVPGKPHLIEHRSCGICCDEISTMPTPTKGKKSDDGETAGGKDA